MHWHINATHYLEQWGDVRTIDGTATIVQPLIAPLYDGKSEYEFIEALIGLVVHHGLRDRAASTGRAR